MRRNRASILVPRRGVPAASPGTIAPPPDAPSPRVRVMVYGPDLLEEHAVKDVTEIAPLRGRDAVTWINIDGVGDASTFQELGRQFGLHALALEDVVNLHQRPKVEDYDDYLYVVSKMPIAEAQARDTEGARLDLEQVSLFLAPGCVITVQEKPGDCLERLRERIRGARGRIRRSGADYLAYAVLDAIIDSYYPVVEGFSSRLERLEEQVLSSAGSDTVAEIHGARHDLHALRQILSATREAMGQMARGSTDLVAEETRVYLRDCLDHTGQLLDAVEACRELSVGLMDLHQSGVNSRMNEAMKVLTLIATIFIPLGFIAGVYGMNFDRAASRLNMPELGWTLGYPFALALMAITAAAFLVVFWRRGWLGGGGRREADRGRGLLPGPESGPESGPGPGPGLGPDTRGEVAGRGRP